MPIEADIQIPSGGFVTLGGELDRLGEQLILQVSGRASKKLLRNIRGDIQRAKLGRLGNAIGQTSDLAKGGRVYREGGRALASGIVHLRSRSERSVGAIISHTKGANILPTKGRFLWIPTDAVQRLVGSRKDRARMTPALYRQRGFEQTIGPLVMIRSINGRPLLAVQNVGQSAVGARGGRVRGLTKSGRARKGDRVRELAVLFVGIPRTSRQARINPRQLAAAAAQEAAAELRGV